MEKQKGEAEREWERKKLAVEKEGGAMAVATGLTFQLKDALNMLDSSPESEEFRSEVLAFLSRPKEDERMNQDDVDANSDDEKHGQPVKGTYKDTKPLNPVLPELAENLQDEGNTRVMQLLQEQREIRAKRKAELQAKEAEPKKRGRPPKNGKDKEASKEDKQEQDQEEMSMEAELDKEEMALKAERAAEDDEDNGKKPPRRRRAPKAAKGKGRESKTEDKEMKKPELDNDQHQPPSSPRSPKPAKKKPRRKAIQARLAYRSLVLTVTNKV